MGTPAAPLADSPQARVDFSLPHAVCISMLGASAFFAPLEAGISMRFVKRRGIVVAICAPCCWARGSRFVDSHTVEDVLTGL